MEEETSWIEDVTRFPAFARATKTPLTSVFRKHEPPEERERARASVVKKLRLLFFPAASAGSK